MMKELTERQKLILTLVVHEHTRTAQPVASNALVQLYNLQMSSATVRNEMNMLTELGYLRQPHTSAGRVPTEEGYRFFVTNLVQQTTLPMATRNTISHQFYQSRQGLSDWLRLAASILASQSQAVSIVTAPHSEQAAFKHLELIATHGTQVLMVLVLVGGEISQSLLALDAFVSQESLSNTAARLNSLCQNATLAEIRNVPIESDSLEERVMAAVVDQMEQADKLVTGEVYLDGLSNILAEPEFSEGTLAKSPLRLLEERPFLDELISKTVLTSDVGGVQVLIGGEGTWQELRECSLILTRYGIPDQMTGALGVLGPMRMPYGHAISTVRFVAGLLSDLVTQTAVE
jgi:heat-inducible transcriptional repressor